MEAAPHLPLWFVENWFSTGSLNEMWELRAHKEMAFRQLVLLRNYYLIHLLKSAPYPVLSVTSRTFINRNMYRVPKNVTRRGRTPLWSATRASVRLGFKTSTRDSCYCQHIGVIPTEDEQGWLGGEDGTKPRQKNQADVQVVRRT